MVLVDDHPIVREGFVSVLREEPDFDIVASVGTVREAVEAAVRHNPRIVVMDVRLPDGTGTDACAQIIQRAPSTRVVILTSAATDAIILDAFSAGARGFVVKESEPAVLRSAIRSIASGGTFVDPRIAGKLVALAINGRRTRGPMGLSMQELRVVERLPKGLTYREIGRELGISDDTVKTHARNAMRKLGAKDRAEAATIAMKKGLL